MKVNIEQALRDFKGKVVTEGDKEVTLKDVLVSIALADLDKEGKDKVGDFNIFMKISNAEKEVDLDSKECTRLQEKVKQTHGTLVVGQITPILDGKPNPLAPVTKV